MADTPKRRWFQFRLRTMLIMMVLLSAVCWFMAAYIDGMNHMGDPTNPPQSTAPQK